jgi:two-component system sensor histidine kinase KdpD
MVGNGGRRLDEARPYLGPLVLGAASLVLATLTALALETWLGVDDASAIYLLAVVVMAGRYGTWPAVAASFAAFLAYDFLFTQPRLTFSVADPQEWLSLLLFLVVAVVIGRLAALQAERAAEATLRAREAETLFGISRSLATASSVREAARAMVDGLREAAQMERVWVAAGPTAQLERVLADTAPGKARPAARLAWLLHRATESGGDDWIRTHTAGTPEARLVEPSASLVAYRVAIEADGQPVGSIWALRDREAGLPSRGATRLLTSAADQIGPALRRERLTAEATSAEVARRSDALKSALLDSVSHDLRTPLATIRAVAGGLLDPEVDSPPEAMRRAAAEIDEQAAHLSDTVRDILDLSRIEAGEIRAQVEVHDLGELVAGVVSRQRANLADHAVRIDVGADLPPVAVDALFFDQVLSNVLENAVQHGGAGVEISIGTQRPEDGSGEIDLLVDDSGRGVEAAEMPRLFEKFRRGRQGGRGRRGLGIGLSIARGMTEAMGGRIFAEPSPLGGLRIRVRLPLAAPEAAADVPPAASDSMIAFGA